MTISEMCNNLNNDLGREYAHWHYYLAASTAVRGLHREELSEFFLEQANGEMKHIEEFRRLLQGIATRRGIDLNITDLVARTEFSGLAGRKKPSELLFGALEMEDKVVREYVLRIDQACELQEGDIEDKVDGKYIELFLEDQILDSRSDADNIREMIADLPFDKSASTK